MKLWKQPKVNLNKIKKNPETLLQQSAILNDTDITDNYNLIGRRVPQHGNLFHAGSSLTIIPITSEKKNDNEDEILQLQTIHETYPSVIK